MLPPGRVKVCGNEDRSYGGDRPLEEVLLSQVYCGNVFFEFPKKVYYIKKKRILKVLECL